MLAVSAILASAPAAAFQSFAIDQLYSSADGTYQFVVLRETQGLAGGHLWAGRTLTVTRPGVARSFTFGGNLASSATAGKRVLVGTQGLAALGTIAVDYVMPNGFLAHRWRHARLRGRESGDLRCAARRRHDRPRSNRRHSLEPRDQFRRGVHQHPGAAGQRDRVSPRGPRSLLHQRSAARPRRARQRAHCRLDPHGTGVQGLAGGGQRTKPGLPLLHSAAARRFALLLRVARRVRDHPAEDCDRSQLQRVHARSIRRVLRRPARPDDRRMRRRHRGGVQAMESARGFQSPLHDEHRDQGADARAGLRCRGLRTGRRRDVRAARQCHVARDGRRRSALRRTPERRREHAGRQLPGLHVGHRQPQRRRAQRQRRSHHLRPRSAGGGAADHVGDEPRRPARDRAVPQSSRGAHHDLGRCRSVHDDPANRAHLLANGANRIHRANGSASA